MDRTGLGKGLSALIPSRGTASRSVIEVPVDLIATNPFQPRRRMDESAIAELAESIKAHGIIQPIVVRPADNGRYELVAGERRLQAARIAGLSQVPVIVRDVRDQESLEIALVENLQREDISPLDAARAYRRLMDEFDLSQEEVASRVGKSRPAVANTLRLLLLPAGVQERLEKGEMSEGHARTLLSLPSPALQALVADEIIRRKCSVREAERLVRGWSKAATTRIVSRETNAPAAKPDLLAVEEQLRKLFQTYVRVVFNEDRGAITIEFYGEEDLNRILSLIGAIPREVQQETR